MALSEEELAELLGFFPEQEQDSHPYGWSYPVELPEDVLHSVTYARAIPIGTASRPFPIQKDADAGDHQSGPPRIIKKKGSSNSVSPYDFHPSCEIPFEWEHISSIEQASLQNAAFKAAPVSRDLGAVGSTGVFNPKYLGIRANFKWPLPAVVAAKELPIDSDPVIGELAQQPSQCALRVFASAKTLAAVVSSSRSLFPFDLVFDKRGNDLFVLTRSSARDVDPAIVETNMETIMTTMQFQRDKMQIEFRANIEEATNINAAFIQFGKDGKNVVHLGPELPEDYGTLAAVYRSIVIENIEFIVRCPVDAVREPPTEGERPKYLICRTFNDVPTQLRRTNWEKELEQKRGATLSGEARANAAKVARWLVITQLLDADACLLGYSVRKTPNSRKSHILLGVERNPPDSLGRVIALLPKTTYGVLLLVFSKMIGLDDGKYAYLRDSKSKLKKTYSIYKMIGGKSLDELSQANDEEDSPLHDLGGN
jgi:hypothetical protein